MNSGHFKFFLHVVSPASRHQVRTFSSSYAPFFAVRQQTLSAISKCTLALACRETHEMHNMLRSTWSLLYPKGHGKLRHLLLSVLELAVTDGVWKIVVKHATKREPCSRCLPQLPQNSPSVLAKPSSSTLSLNFPWSSLLSSWERSPCVLRWALVDFQTFADFSSLFCLISGSDPAATFCSAWDHVTWGSPEQQKL